MDRAQTMQLKALGARLSLYVRSGDKSLSRAALQAVAADLVAELPELGQPLGDMLGRPGFQTLIPLAGLGKGELERDAFLQDASRLYLPEVVAALREVLNGFLECSVAVNIQKTLPKIVVSASDAPASLSVQDLSNYLHVECEEVLAWLHSRGVCTLATQVLDGYTVVEVVKEFFDKDAFDGQGRRKLQSEREQEMVDLMVEARLRNHSGAYEPSLLAEAGDCVDSARIGEKLVKETIESRSLEREAWASDKQIFDLNAHPVHSELPWREAVDEFCEAESMGLRKRGSMSTKIVNKVEENLKISREIDEGISLRMFVVWVAILAGLALFVGVLLASNPAQPPGSGSLEQPKR